MDSINWIDWIECCVRRIGIHLIYERKWNDDQVAIDVKMLGPGSHCIPSLNRIFSSVASGIPAMALLNRPHGSERIRVEPQNTNYKLEGVCV